LQESYQRVGEGHGSLGVGMGKHHGQSAQMSEQQEPLTDSNLLKLATAPSKCLLGGKYGSLSA
jgi:hypothetical protein